MAAIPEMVDPTLAAMDAAMVERQDTSRRGYLGASSIGAPCSRQLWYSFRWAAPVSFNAETLKRFEDGHRGEALMVERLSKVPGVVLSTHAPDGSQWGMQAHEGHFRGHCDGFIKGLLQAPKTAHIWEHKVCNEAKQKKLAKLKTEKGEKEALAHWDPVYYAQAQVYMHAFDQTRHYLTCSSPGERTTVSVRTNYNQEHAENLMARAKDIIVSDQPPVRISEDSTSYLCKWCDYHTVCHDITPMAVNCRTCINSYPDHGGEWSCTRHGGLPKSKQVMGCPDYQGINA
jgi:CRISPR/Cas system-associated exonuclease Cas4 (RecB family)